MLQLREVDEILSEFPELEREDVYEALAFVAEAMEERFIPSEEALTSRGDEDAGCSEEKG